MSFYVVKFELLLLSADFYSMCHRVPFVRETNSSLLTLFFNLNLPLMTRKLREIRCWKSSTFCETFQQNNSVWNYELPSFLLEYVRSKGCFHISGILIIGPSQPPACIPISSVWDQGVFKDKITLDPLHKCLIELISANMLHIPTLAFRWMSSQLS